MAAPAGVNEGLPPEPVTSGAGNAGLAEGAPTEPTEAGPAGHAGILEHAEGVEQPMGRAVLHGDVAALAEAPVSGEPREAAGPEPGGAADEDHSRRDLSPLAIVGIAVGIMALVGAAFGVLAVITHGFRAKVVVTYRPAAVFRLRPGDCIDSGPNGLAVTRLSCATPHDAEVFAAFSLPKASWPGTAAIRQLAGDSCASRLMGYLNPQLADAGLSQEFVYPDQAAWKAGVRTVVCEVSSPSGRLSGSVRNPGS